MFVSRVQPVMMRFAVLSICWSSLSCVSEMMGEVMVLAYSILGLVMALYVTESVSLDLPHVVAVRALSILRLLLPLSEMFCMCLL